MTSKVTEGAGPDAKRKEIDEIREKDYEKYLVELEGIRSEFGSRRSGQVGSCGDRRVYTYATCFR